MDGTLRRRWMRACIVGELLGFVPPAVTGVVLVAAGAPELVLVLGLVVAGAAEGVILGLSQAGVIERELPGLTGWVQATAIGAAIAWLAGMGGSALVQAFGPVALVVTVPGWFIGLLAMGVLQWRRLQIVVADTRNWVWWNSLAWLAGVMPPVAALSVVPNGWPPVAHVVVGVVAAVGMGAIVGAITARPLRRYVQAFAADQHVRRVMGITSEAPDVAGWPRR